MSGAFCATACVKSFQLCSRAPAGTSDVDTHVCLLPDARVIHSLPPAFQFLLAGPWHEVIPQLHVLLVSSVLSLGGAPKL